MSLTQISLFVPRLQNVETFPAAAFDESNKTRKLSWTLPTRIKKK